MKKRRYINRYRYTQDKYYIKGKKDEESQDREKFNWFDTSLIIGFVTIMGYFIAYTYKKGFLSYYGVSPIFISQIDMITILISITTVGAIAFIAYISIVQFYKMLEGFENPYIKLFNREVYQYTVILIFIYFLDSRFVIFYSFFILFLIIMTYIIPLIRYRDIQGYKNKIEQAIIYAEEEGFNFKNLFSVFKYVQSQRIVIVLFVSVFLYPVITTVGVKVAEFKRDYYIVNKNNTNYLIIDKINEGFIVAPINIENLTMEKEFQVIGISSDLENELSVRYIEINKEIKVFDKLKP